MRDVILIASSSRGGSSVFSAFLRRSRVLCHLQGEINPLLRLDGLSYPEAGTGSDVLTAQHAAGSAGAQVRSALAEESGAPALLPLSPSDWQRFLVILHQRLQLQWPQLSILPEQVTASAEAARPHLSADLGAFHAVFLRHFSAEHPAVNPYYYDLSRRLIAQRCPSTRPDGPPSARVIEEPPFVTVAPWDASPPSLAWQSANRASAARRNWVSNMACCAAMAVPAWSRRSA